MSKLSDLIKNLCPLGVEFKKLGEVIKRYSEKAKNDKNIKIVYAVSKNDGLIPSLDYWQKNNGKKRADYQIYSDDVSNYNIIRKNMFAYNPARLNIGSIDCLFEKENGLLSPMYVVFEIDEKILLPKFLLIFLKSEKIIAKIDSMKEEGARFRFDFKNWNKIKIPVPPLEVQKEIVRILDTFTELIEKLSEELSLRKKQYEFYASKLFCETDAEIIELARLAKFVYGFTAAAKDFGDTRFIRITDINEQGHLKENEKKFITLTEESKKSLLKKGDLVMARTGATYGKTLYFDNDMQSVFASFLIKIIPCEKLLSKYYWHFTKTPLYSEQIKKLVTEGGQPQFNTPALKKIKIPLPPIEEQERIVKILDSFDKLCNDLSEGLPAEIEARKKQYEYYRDKLLTFEEFVN